MADRVLTWHFPRGGADNEDKTDVSVAYVADEDYVPVRVIMRAKTAPVTGQTRVDIKVQLVPEQEQSEATSIFGDDFRPELQQGDDLLISDVFFNGADGDGIIKDSVITIDIPDYGPGCLGLTVSLELDLDD